MGNRKSKQQRKAFHALGETLGVRLSEVQRKRLRQACDVAATRKGEVVEESVLARDFIMRCVDELLEPAGAGTR